LSKHSSLLFLPVAHKNGKAHLSNSTCTDHVVRTKVTNVAVKK